jgi:hypothetical protein
MMKAISAVLFLMATACGDAAVDETSETAQPSTTSSITDPKVDTDSGLTQEVVKAVLMQLDECSDSAHCPGSEAVKSVLVQKAALPEVGWRPPGPYHEEPCNGIDEDGDGADNCPSDVDGDGTSADYDCDDRDPTRYVGAAEAYCDDIDQNCDGIDVCDADGDGTSNLVDCDDNNPAVEFECFDIEPDEPLD